MPPPVTEFKRVLIANRGEIALRVVRACRDAALASVAVYADADAGAPFVRQADEAVALHGTSATDTYLDVAKLLAAAQQAGADAVHPGYGFLAENADFARAVLDAGLTWVGPPPDVIRALGDKVAARAIAARAGAPLVPGTPRPVTGAAEAVEFARQHGLPVAIKAAHGGGGRGMRIARDLGEIPDLLDAAAAEARVAFGRGECFVEVYIDGGRHIEAQVLADSRGTVQVIGTRDCTLQRRYQKLIEEAPAPFLAAGQQSELERAAAAICRAAGYVGAGTVEFLLSPAGELSFLEVNTRLQVEHSVTEETSDVDLVRAQLLIAAGHPLAVAVGSARPQDRPGGPRDTTARRHAIEFRINAEDPARGFAPQAGTITRFCPPSGPGVRLDSGIEAGSVIGDQFDSLLAKLIITGRDRTQAIERSRRALAEFDIAGVATTLPFLRAAVSEPAFTADGPGGFAVHTRWIEQDYRPAAAEPAPGAGDQQDSRVAIRIGSRWLAVDVPGLTQAREGPLLLAREHARERLERAELAAGDLVSAPMQGTVTRVAVAEGDEVRAGQVLAVVEAMKMENPLLAPHAGRVTGLSVAAGDTVAQGAALCRVTGPEPGSGGADDDMADGGVADGDAADGDAADGGQAGA